MNNITILAHLLSHKTEQFTINQIAKALSLNYRIAHTQVKSLENAGLLKTTKVGNALLCSLSGTYSEEMYLAESMRRNQPSKELLQVKSRFEKANQNFTLLLFGSYAKGTQTKHSDIDLLAITEDGKELEEIAELIPKDIHLTTVTYNSFIDMANSKELSVVSEAMSNNIILIGIENYYRLQQNAARKTNKGS